MSTEFELKLASNERSLRQIEAALLKEIAEPTHARTERQRTVYFDTKAYELQKAGASFRVREAGGAFVQTVKTKDSSRASPLTRREWETRIADLAPNLDALGVRARRALPRKTARRLQSVFETDIERRTLALDRDGAQIELAFDRGRIVANGRTQEVFELELELMAGSSATLFRFAADLVRRNSLRLALRTKADRGYDLAEGAEFRPVAAANPQLRRRARTGQAFAQLAESCLYQIAANWEPVDRGDPEGVHRMRVGLRKLRALISIFSAMTADEETTRLKGELKWLTSKLAPARQIWVFRTGALAELQADFPEGVRSAFSNEIERRLQQAHEAAKEAVNSDRFRTLLLALAQWIYTGDWRTRDEKQHRALRERKVVKTAADVLERRTRKLRKRGEGLAELDAGARHKFRIAVKKLRYSEEFFGALFTGARATKRRKRFRGVLKELQASLGDLNDIAAHQTFCAEIADEAWKSGAASRGVAFTAGVASADQRWRIAPMLRESCEAQDRLQACRAFWT